MDELPNIIPKSIVEVLNRLENDEDNRFFWKLSRNKDSLSLTVSCSLRAKNPNKDKGASEVTERVIVKPVKRRRKKKKSPSALARSRDRHTRFLEKKLAGNPGLASPEGKSVTAVPREQDSDNSQCAKELENTSLTCGSRSNRNSVSSENPTPASDLDLIRECLDTDSDDNDDDVSSATVYSIICSNCKHPPRIGQDLVRCSDCQTCYCSIQCQKKDWEFHRFACSIVGKQSDIVKV